MRNTGLLPFPDCSRLRDRLWLELLAVVLLVMCFAGLADAQTPSVTLTANPTTAVSKATPALTLDVSGQGTRVVTCTAAGGWTGTKVPGTTTQPEITATTTYSVTCSAPEIPQVTTARLVWELPTHNTDGTPYTDAKGFVVYGAQTQAGLASAIGRNVTNPSATSVTYTGIGQPGTWWFCVKAMNLADALSPTCSNAASKTIAPATPAWSETKSVTVTITAPSVPNPPTNLVVTDVTAFAIEENDDGSLVALRVELVPVGTTCSGDECVVRTRRGPE